MGNAEQINALLIQLAKQQQELNAKEKEIKILEKENANLKNGISKKGKTNIKGIYEVVRASGEKIYGFTIYDENGKRIRRENFESQTAADRARRSLLILRDKRKLAAYINNENITFDDLNNNNNYTTYCNANNFAINTLTAGESIYRNHLSFFSDMKITKITKPVVQTWAVEAKKNMGPTAYNNTIKKAKAIWNCALKNDLTTLQNPFNILTPINIKKEKTRRETVRIDREQAKILISVAKNMFNDYTAPMIACGVCRYKRRRSFRIEME